MIEIHIQRLEGSICNPSDSDSVQLDFEELNKIKARFDELFEEYFYDQLIKTQLELDHRYRNSRNRPSM